MQGASSKRLPIRLADIMFIAVSLVRNLRVRHLDETGRQKEAQRR